ncbi:sensor histidine kinase [Clostridium lacusfryxellense]|uniref:sensor histidine kinase n=1 Tax=Clostridium lacusfryxellense TaxID=205328 RepID=UPI001C0BBDD4|nr:HAMP domain-containing sensor histidine kinase [Clostridium lacusfryxellense]MBU3112259.1 HAMP domain-containing histidine kinase [Clostridium lacusfryxellense]
MINVPKAKGLIIANLDLAFQIEEKADRAAELIIANKKLAFQSEEKADRAAELLIANKELAFQNEEKADRAAELLIANKELAYQSEEKADRAAELIIANIELAFQIEEKADRAAELIIANKELTFQNEEKGKRAAELIIANKELTFQNEEKGKRAAELIIANKELAFQNEEKGKRAAELIIANKELIIANKAQGEFLVNISHELKTPLNVIFSTAQLFEMYCKSGSLDDKKDSIIKYIQSMKLNSYRLSKLINNIVDLSKIEAGFFKLSLSNNNIVEVVEEIVMSITALTDSKGLNIIFDTNIEEKIIACDTEKIERIVLNLISNAIKFSNEGDEIFVQIKDKNEFVEISVKDNGIGIEDEYLDMIFDRFKQVDKSLSRNTEGTGVGLSLVKSIVELHGGSIHANSVFGKGSKFTVRLPSKKVLQENMIYNNKMRNGNETIRVELSDIYL